MTLFIWIAAFLFAQPPSEIPIAQVTVLEMVLVYPEPSILADAQTRFRPGDVVALYEIQNGWGQSAKGWLLLDGQRIDPAVVGYGAVFEDDLAVSAVRGGQPVYQLAGDDVVGVAAIFEGSALVYGQAGAGWVSLDKLQLTAPQPDLVDFVERRAYVKVESVDLRALPDETAEGISFLLLGEEVRVLFQGGDWVLVKTDTAFGWSQSTNFDILPSAVVRGEMNASPVNLRRVPDGQVIGVLEYRESVLVVGRDEAEEWLFIRLPARGLEGWVAAQFVDFAGERDDLPVIGFEG